MLIPYLKIYKGFYPFIYQCSHVFRENSILKKNYDIVSFLVLNILFGGFFQMLYIQHYLNQRIKKFEKRAFIFIAIIYEIIFYQIQLFINQVIILGLLIHSYHKYIYSDFISLFLFDLNKIVENGTDFCFIKDELK